LPALVRAVRYGDVRGSDSSQLAEVAEGLAERICVGLPPACVGLDADGAQALREHIDAVHQAVNLLSQDTSAASEPAQEHSAAQPGEPGVEPGPRSGAGDSGPAAEPGRAGRSADTASGLDGLPARWSGVLRSLAERDRVP